MSEITDEQREVLEIKFEGGEKVYLNSGSYMSVEDPYYATRYPPTEDLQNRIDGRNRDMNWMKNSFHESCTFNFVPFLPACEEYKSNIKFEEE